MYMHVHVDVYGYARTRVQMRVSVFVYSEEFTHVTLHDVTSHNRLILTHILRP